MRKHPLLGLTKHSAEVSNHVDNAKNEALE